MNSTFEIAKSLAITITNELKQLVSLAEEKGIDVEREKGTIWFAEQFVVFAQWDEDHIDVNQRMFTTIPEYAPFGKTPDDLANELGAFQLNEVIDMVKESIEELQKVMDGAITRLPVRMFDWSKVEMKDGNFYCEDKPVFLHDYNQKSIDEVGFQPNHHNPYLGNMGKAGERLSLKALADADGTLDESMSDAFNPVNDNIGMLMINHYPPEWMKDESYFDGVSYFTKYDIYRPEMRAYWEKIFATYMPKFQDQSYFKLGYCLANEPHWCLEKDFWAVIKKHNGDPGMSELGYQALANHLEKIYKTLEAMNQNWESDYESFLDASKQVVPLETAKHRKKNIWYDICKYNMDETTEWFKFLNDTIKKYNPDALTHVKIMPDFFVEENSFHGLNFEDLTELTDMVSDDAKINKFAFKRERDTEWSNTYAYYWKELMTYDFMSSVSNSAHINSECHALSTVRHRDLYMKPSYVRSTYWLMTLLGMDANITWFWARKADGAILDSLFGYQIDGAMYEAYPATVCQQPRVANELSRTMMELNTFSEEIVRMQKQKKPIRIFYSETSAILEDEFINDQYQIYQTLFFNGLPTGFATQKIIEKQDHQLWDVVVVYKVPHVTDGEFATIQSYLADGGVVVMDQESLKYNEYRQLRTIKLKEGNGTLIVMDGTDKDLAERAYEYVNTKIFPPIICEEENGLEQRTTLWRVFHNHDFRFIMSLNNMGKNTSTIKLNTIRGKKVVSVTNLLTGQLMEPKFVMESEEVLMLAIILE